ncbi:hypothetical protein L6452_34459 [Arctium lappa]|uniref:Uncharacterized protein n=1 Tax=Arctium lappa TaxID=4217 RepID=A0ACB8YID7_ARCLA|nr:hypothetical protein L6452_34459 [Arctium lappa]
MTSTGVRRSSLRSPSLSSTSSSSLGSISFFLDDDSPPPATPPGYFAGIPFSWEQFPGIPKKNNTHKDSSHTLLPLPPSSGHSFRKNIKKYTATDSFHKDPFFAAFVECSKDDDHHHELVKVSKSRFSDRSGLASVYTSCKRTCEVAESIVYLPRSRAGGYFYR